jgi:hypothetical protein
MVPGGFLSTGDGVKACYLCGEEKPLDHYHKDKSQPGGLRGTCKNCRRLESLRDKCPDCGRSKRKASKVCKDCNRGSNHSQWRGGRIVNGAGYVLLTGYVDHPNAMGRGQILEHVLVMSEQLGRPLYENEQVHHKNGVRADNRPENLELWAKSHPAGQRVEDLLAWAHEIIERYENE